MKQAKLFDGFKEATQENFINPEGYKGLYGFHKYWGKKPAETVAYLIEQLTEVGGVVVDPFLGFGAIAREAAIRKRRFLGCDLNPVSIELAKLLVNPPTKRQVEDCFKSIKEKVKRKIESSYLLENGNTATHYLWEGPKLEKVWTRKSGKRLRIELSPTDHDLAIFKNFSVYQVRNLRPLRMFQNSRINSKAGMGWEDIFTGRALRNLELLREAILKIEEKTIRHALLMGLNASVGQMSKMVFAIEKRGSTKNKKSLMRTEVGSWVIGFWRPKKHFEINVWNCFENKMLRLLKGLEEAEDIDLTLKVNDDIDSVLTNSTGVSLKVCNALNLLKSLPDGSIDLVITDPPHGDRIPYLELSEIWNAILNKEPIFEDEIVISNAHGRDKCSTEYKKSLENIFQVVGEKLTPCGIVAVMFNSKSKDEWHSLQNACKMSNLVYFGKFPMKYSAGSVVQDNRSGGLSYDNILLFGSSNGQSQSRKMVNRFGDLPGWSNSLPVEG